MEEWLTAGLCWRSNGHKPDEASMLEGLTVEKYDLRLVP